MRFFDTHCHLDFDEFNHDRELVLGASRQQGVHAFLVPSVSQERFSSVRQLAGQHSDVFSAFGLHPYFLTSHQPTHLCDLEAEVSKGSCVAVGEFGLDFYSGKTSEQLQHFYFDAQMNIAKNAHLPVVLHVRKAHQQVLEWIKKNNFSEGGVIHAYSGDFNTSKQYYDLGFKLGIGGVVTYERSTKVRAMVYALPLEQILLETDSPDMPIDGQKSNRNSPENIISIFNALSTLRPESSDILASKIYQNSLDVFRISDAHMILD